MPCIYDQMIFNKGAKTIWYFQEIALRKLDIHMVPSKQNKKLKKKQQLSFKNDLT